MKDTFAIKLLAILYRQNKRNVEYSEHFYSVFPKIAIENTLGFVQALNSLDIKTQKITIEKLEVIRKKENLDKLVENLNSINQTEFKETTDHIKELLTKEFLIEFE